MSTEKSSEVDSSTGDEEKNVGEPASNQLLVEAEPEYLTGWELALVILDLSVVVLLMGLVCNSPSLLNSVWTNQASQDNSIIGVVRSEVL
jgi:hypothetical protein